MSENCLRERLAKLQQVLADLNATLPQVYCKNAYLSDVLTVQNRVEEATTISAEIAGHLLPMEPDEMIVMVTYGEDITPDMVSDRLLALADEILVKDEEAKQNGDLEPDPDDLDEDDPDFDD